MATTQPAAKSDPEVKKRSIRVRTRSGGGDSSVPGALSDVWTLSVDYAKQEIRDPLKGLGSYLAWGAAGMLLIGMGCVLLALGALRALQTETGSTFTGSWSWAPYAIVLVGALVVLALGFVMSKRRRK